jgi:hypothetical protein
VVIGQAMDLLLLAVVVVLLSYVALAILLWILAAIFCLCRVAMRCVRPRRA